MMLVLMTTLCAVYVALAVTMTRRHLELVDQTLNHDLAATIAKDTRLIDREAISEDAFRHSLNKIMGLNPSIEVYLLAADGTIEGYSAPPGRVRRRAVSLAPIRAFLERREAPPILGDDPRDPEGTKIFSAAQVGDARSPSGYVYVVLGGEQYDSVASMLRNSQLLRLALASVVASLVVVAVVGLVSFRFLTRRLRRLGIAVEAFSRHGFETPLSLPPPARTGDEIDLLGKAFLDMAHRIRAQMQLLASADQARRGLMAGISHDLRTPLSALLGYIETVLMKEGSLADEQRRQFLGLALRNGRQLSHLVDELFEFSTLDAGERAPKIEQFSLGDLVQDVCQKFSIRADEAGIKLHSTIPLWTVLVFGDVALVERVLDNLIDNALKFTPRDGTVGVVLEPASGDRIAVVVRDSGTGIPEEHLSRIFEPFYRIERGSPERRDGVGLGLAIAARIAALHGTSIGVRSAAGSGTTFRLDLPTVAE
jgi:signal transduction histidine kinase